MRTGVVLAVVAACAVCAACAKRSSLYLEPGRAAEPAKAPAAAPMARENLQKASANAPPRG
jgi:hypothetical protein